MCKTGDREADERGHYEIVKEGKTRSRNHRPIPKAHPTQPHTHIQHPAKTIIRRKVRKDNPIRTEPDHNALNQLLAND